MTQDEIYHKKISNLNFSYCYRSNQ